MTQVFSSLQGHFHPKAGLESQKGFQGSNPIPKVRKLWPESERQFKAALGLEAKCPAFLVDQAFYFPRCIHSPAYSYAIHALML